MNYKINKKEKTLSLYINLGSIFSSSFYPISLSALYQIGFGEHMIPTLGLLFSLSHRLPEQTRALIRGQGRESTGRKRSAGLENERVLGLPQTALIPLQSLPPSRDVPNSSSWFDFRKLLFIFSGHFWILWHYRVEKESPCWKKKKKKSPCLDPRITMNLIIRQMMIFWGERILNECFCLPICTFLNQVMKSVVCESLFGKK